MVNQAVDAPPQAFQAAIKTVQLGLAGPGVPQGIVVTPHSAVAFQQIRPLVPLFPVFGEQALVFLDIFSIQGRVKDINILVDLDYPKDDAGFADGAGVAGRVVVALGNIAGRAGAAHFLVDAVDYIFGAAQVGGGEQGGAILVNGHIAAAEAEGYYIAHLQLAVAGRRLKDDFVAAVDYRAHTAGAGDAYREFLDVDVNIFLKPGLGGAFHIVPFDIGLSPVVAAALAGKDDDIFLEIPIGKPHFHFADDLLIGNAGQVDA